MKIRRALLGLAIALAMGGCAWISPRPRGVWRGIAGVSRRPGVAVGSAAFEAELDCFTASVARPGNRASLLQNGDEVFPAMLAAIRGARCRISMTTYIVERDEVADEFFDALADAAARGVEVRFAADAVGFRRGRIARLDDLSARGVRTRIFNPLLASWTVLRFNNRDHRKILVVDGGVAFVGGVNLSAEQRGDGVTGWRDTAVRVEGSAARDVEMIFARSWRQAGRGYWGMDWPWWGARGIKRAMDAPFRALSAAAGWRDDFVPPGVPEEDSAIPPEMPPDVFGGAEVAARALWTDPAETSSPIYEALLLALARAEETAELTTAYFAPPRALRRALIDAAGRGVRVRLLLPGVTDVPLSRTVAEAYYRELLAAGVEIREWPHPIWHAKTAVVDGRWSLVGSANWDARSFALSHEASLAMTGETFGRQMRLAFERDWERSTPMDPETWARRGAGRRIRGMLLRPVAGQF